MSCNLVQQQQVVVHMVQIEGMVEVEEGVVAVVAMVEAIHGIDHTEAVVAQFVHGSGIRSVAFGSEKFIVTMSDILLPRHIYYLFPCLQQNFCSLIARHLLLHRSVV